MAYHHLTLGERTLIDIGREKGFSVRELAKQLGRSPSTISRECKRNTRPRRSYKANSAAKLCSLRRSDHTRLKLLKDKELADKVDKWLRKGWSPEQISGRLACEAPAIRISFNAIYRYVYWLKRHFPKKVKWFRRCPARYRKKRRCPFGPLGKRPIALRCEAANARLEKGHWEGDTIVTAPGKPALLVYVDRKTRFVIIRSIASGKSALVTKETITALYSAGKTNRKTITLDNGSEFAGYRDFEHRLKMPVYFCQPHSPWERPTVENTNGLIRQMTRKKDLRKMTQNDVDKLAWLINNRPRKCLNYKTPAEEFG